MADQPSIPDLLAELQGLDEENFTVAHVEALVAGLRFHLDECSAKLAVEEAAGATVVVYTIPQAGQLLAGYRALMDMMVEFVREELDPEPTTPVRGEATRQVVDEAYGTEMLSIDGHYIQCGGANGDGYCYAHESFSCIASFTDEQRDRVQTARVIG